MIKKSLGISNTSYGEILQGRTTNGEDFLVSLPCDLYSTCFIEYDSANNDDNVVFCDKLKAQTLIEYCIEYSEYFFGFRGCFKVSINSNIPVGKGMSSSTADLCAALRALSKLAGCELKCEDFSELIKLIEPHDPVFVSTCCVYNHRSGKLIKNLEYIPQVSILSVDGKKMVDTLEYNQSVTFDLKDQKFYDESLASLIDAFNFRDDQKIFNISSMSALKFLKNKNDPRVDLINWAHKKKNTGFLGVVIGHSGSCIGFVFKRNSREEMCRMAREIVEEHHIECTLLETLSNE